MYCLTIGFAWYTLKILILVRWLLKISNNQRYCSTNYLLAIYLLCNNPPWPAVILTTQIAILQLPGNPDQQHSQSQVPSTPRSNNLPMTSASATASKAPSQPTNSGTIPNQHRQPATRSQMRGSLPSSGGNAATHQAYPVVSTGQNNVTSSTTVARPRPRMPFSNIPR